MGRSKQPKLGAGPLVLLCLFVVAIVAMCAVGLSWNARNPAPSSSAPSSAAASSSAASKSASSAAASKAVSSGSGKPSSSSATSSQSTASSSSLSADVPVVNAGPNGTYLLNTEADIRAAGYDQMNADNKNAVGDNWKTAAIANVVLQGAMGEITDFNYVGQEVYSVRFMCEDAKRDPPEICTYLAMDTGKMLGYGYYD